MSSDIWYIEKDLCRCCHSEGTHKKLSESKGDEKVYSEMLKDYLDINLSPAPGWLCAPTYTICEACILRLQDATNFKRQVLSCEEKFDDMCKRNLIKVADNEPEVKVELEDTFFDVFKDDYSTDDDGFELKYDDEDENNTDVDVEESKKGKSKTAKAKPKSKTETKKGKKVGKTRKQEEDGENAEGTKKKKIKNDSNETPQEIQENKTKEERDTFACNECPAVMNSMEYFANHIKKHKEEVPCPICNEKFFNQKEKKKHLIKEHGMTELTFKTPPEMKTHVCNICRKEYTKRQGLAKHMSLVHTIVECSDCDEMMAPKDLPYHRNEAHGATIPTCDLCGYKNSRNHVVLTHKKKVHLKEKNVACSFCGREFFDVALLKRHLAIHSEERKFDCRFCDKKFLRKETLRMHEMIHTGEKRKHCDVCGLRFIQVASLKYHMAKYHNNNSDQADSADSV